MPEAGSETKLLAGENAIPSRKLNRARDCLSATGARADPIRSQDSNLRWCRILHTEMCLSLRPLFRILLLLPAISASCSSRPGVDAPLFGSGVFHPPPKPGASISQTRMCECVACEPRSCCGGAEDDEPPPTCNTENYVFDPRCEP